MIEVIFKVVLFLLKSFWFVILTAVGVSFGLRNFFNDRDRRDVKEVRSRD